DLPLRSEFQRVEQVGGPGVGVAAAPGTGRPVGQTADVVIRMVKVGRGPGAAVLGADRRGADLFAGLFEAGAEVVLHRTGLQLRAQVGLVGGDRVFLILERGQSTLDQPAGRVGQVR